MSDPVAKKPGAPPPPPRKGCLRSSGQFVLTLAVLLAIGAVGVATWANWRKDGRFSVRVFDPAWWTVGRREAEPYVEGAKTAAQKVQQSLWGEGGMVDQAEAWLDGLRRTTDAAAAPAPAGDAATPEGPAGTASRPADTAPAGSAGTASGTPAPAKPAPTTKSAAARQGEEAFRTAESAFQNGLAAYKRARPGTGTPAQQKVALAEAGTHFRRCRDLLARHLEPYKTAAGSDPAVLNQAEQLAVMNQRFLFNVNRMSGGL